MYPNQGLMVSWADSRTHIQPVYIHCETISLQNDYIILILFIEYAIMMIDKD